MKHLRTIRTAGCDSALQSVAHRHDADRRRDVMVAPQQTYAARLEIDYPERLDRVTTLFRVVLIIPIAIVLSLVSASASSTTVIYQSGEVVEKTTSTGGGIAGGLFAATALMIVIRQRYPRW